MIEWMMVVENMVLVFGFLKKCGLINWVDVDMFVEEVLKKVGCDFSLFMWV